MTALEGVARCPDCGTELGLDAVTKGVCPRCLLSLALLRSPPDSDVETGPDSEAATLDRPTTGQILGVDGGRSSLRTSG